MAHHQHYQLPAAWDEAIHGWEIWLRLSGMSSATVQLRREHLRSVAHRTASPTPTDLTLDTLAVFLGSQDWSLEYRRSMRTALIGFYDWAVKRGIAPENVAAQLPRVRTPHAKPRPATEQQFHDLLAQAAPRERLMARLAGELGLRRAEVAKCHMRDLVRDSQGWSLIVVGKGNKQRTVPVPDDLADEICNFCRGGWFFPNPMGGHLSPQYVGILISRMLGPATMHQLRHRFASLGYQRTHDLRALQTVLGHSSLSTTQRYVQGADTAERRLVEEVAQAYKPALSRP